MRKFLPLLCLLTVFGMLKGQTVPELLYYKFDGAGTSVTNEASTPPGGTATATINGSQSQGSAGLCGGALIGTGGSSSTDYVNTGWATTLNGSWTLSFWSNNVPNTTTLHYIFGDPGASSFRCFTGGVAGGGNWILRGPVSDVLVTGGASTTPSVTTFVYDATVPEVRAYLNGNLVNTVGQGVVNVSSAGPFKVGGYSSSTGLPAGALMDEFRFYNRALDANEVMLVYNQCLPLASAPNDAGATLLNSPAAFCPDSNDVIVTITNHGTDILDSCWVNWEFAGVPQTPVQYVGPLDTFGGLGPNTAQVYLGTKYFAPQTPYDLKVWTSLPNGMADTVAFNDTLTATVQASLTGVFNIGGPSADYPSFTAAVADLVSYGVCGPVVFNVHDSLFIEQIALPSIDGASSTNTVTFRAASGTPTLQYDATGSADNWVVELSGGDYITFDGITFRSHGTVNYNRVFYIHGGSEYNTLQNCHLVGDTNQTTTSTNIAVIYSNTDQDNYNSYLDNTIEGGSYGVYYYGSGTTSLEAGTVWDGNTFLNQYYYGFRTYYQDTLRFTNNLMSSNRTYTSTTYGFFFGYADNGARITHNRIMTDNSTPRYGMYFTNTDGNSGTENLIANNFIHVGNAGNTNTHYGIYFSGGFYNRIYHNSIYLEDAGTGSRGVYVTGGGNNEFLNNNVVAETGYAAYFNSTSSVTNSNYNNFLSNGTNLMYYAGAHTTLASYQTASTQDANSMSVDPMFYSADDLHACNDTLMGAAMVVADVTDDYDHEARDSMPDIGADEMVRLAPGFLGADSTICSNDSVLYMVGTPSDTVMWSNGSMGNSVWLSTPGVYWVDVSNPCGTVSDTVEIFASNLVYNNFLIADTNQGCIGDTIALYASMGFDSYAWSTGDSTPTLGVTNTGIYVLNASDACGAGADSVTVIFYDAPTAVFTHTSNMFTCTFTNNSTNGGGTNSYLWDFGDGNTSVIDNPSHTYTANGNYVVTLTVTNECGTDVITDTCVIDVVAIDQALDFGVSLYPNPARNDIYLTAELSGEREVGITLLTPMGQVIRTESLGTLSGAVQHRIDLAGLASGVYFLRVQADDRYTVRQFVVRRQ